MKTKDDWAPGECPAAECPGTLTTADTTATGSAGETIQGYEIVCSSDPAHSEEHLG